MKEKVPASPHWSLREELAEIERSIAIAQATIRYAKKRGTKSEYDKSLAAQRDIIAKAQAEIDGIERDFRTADAKIAKEKRRITKLQHRRKLLENKREIERLAKLKRDSETLRNELDEKGVPHD